ncbi:hypothetical protein JNW90_13805 [Micromonospora sp. STR1s_5]|nr:hypothetical protein [Micromonospora sp. STR1s_5]
MRKLMITVAVLAPMSAQAAPLDRGWWVVAGSFPTTLGAHTATEARMAQLTRCGAQPFNDFSGKFEGFAQTTEIEVVVLGPYQSRDRADTVRAQVSRCVPDAYVKWGRYYGE